MCVGEYLNGLRGLNAVKRVFHIGLNFVEEVSQLPHSVSCGFVVHTTFKYAECVRTMHAIGEGSHEDRGVLIKQLHKILPNGKAGGRPVLVSAKTRLTEI